MHILRRAFVVACIAFYSSDYSSETMAAQVVPMSLTQLADHAGQVIVGEVASVRTYWDGDPRRIESEVIFRDVSILKGQPSADATFKLTVPGGKIGELQMRVCCAPEFRAGDKWVLMLLPTYKTFPIVGVYRGAMRVKADANGVERVYDVARKPITGVDNDGHLRVEGELQNNAASHLVGARGARLQPTTLRSKEKSEAMRLTEFVGMLTPVLTMSRNHSTTEPAGRRVAADLRAVALKTSRAGEEAKRGAGSSRELPSPPQASTDPRSTDPHSKGAKP